MRRAVCRWLLVAIVSSLLIAEAAVPSMGGENYALLVAVGSYDMKELRPLKFTRADVLEFHQALLDSGFQSKNVVLMHDDLKQLVAHYETLGPDYDPKNFLPLAANVRRRLELLLGRLRPDDSVMVAFAGHGVQFKNEKKSYFCPVDAKLTEKETLIGFDEVFAALKDCAAGRKLFLVDACQNDPLSEIARSRATVELDSVTRPQNAKVPEGIIALFSCKAGQKSYEVPELGHGVFFYHLLDGWKGNADRNGDGRITYKELAEYTEIKTAEFADLKLGALQTPLLKAEFSGEWILRELSRPPFDATQSRTAAESKSVQEAWAKHLKTTVEVRNSLDMRLRLIPPGDYFRGTTAEQAEDVLRAEPRFRKRWLDAEQPRHRVRLTKPFLLCSTEVTRGQFARFVKATGYVTDAEKDPDGGFGHDETTKGPPEQKKEYNWRNLGFTQTDDHPVGNVSWNDATEFCQWLSQVEGREYRLPTEAEWEYACRAGTVTRFFTGDDGESLEKFANVADESCRRAQTPDDYYPYTKFDDGYAYTAPVGSFRPNAFGLFDMHGNMTEWCADCHEDKEYAQFADRPAIDPTGPVSADRVIRGGSWLAVPSLCRASNRNARGRYNFSDIIGFRVALSLGGKER